jgi:hypothetical protein
MEFVKRAGAQDASYAFEPLRKFARRFPVVKRYVRKVFRLARAAEYRTRSRLRWLPKIRGSPAARLGVYVAYFDAAEIFRLHLTSFRQNTAGGFNYYVMKNCTTFSEARRFDAIVSEYGFPTVFTTWPPHEPFAHDDSLQRMVDQTTDEVIVVCDVDAFPVMRGWDEFILAELETKDAVGAVVHMPDRAGPRTVLHPCFLAFRRSFLEAHGLQVRRHGDGDPCGRITEYLLANGRFHEGCVTPLLPTAHEMELFAGFTHDPAFGSSNLRHGFGTTYGGLALHLWFWRIVARRRPVVGADGTVLVGVEQMEKVLESLRSRFGGAEHASSEQVPRDVPWTAHPVRGNGDDA